MKNAYILLISLLFVSAFAGCKEDENIPSPATGLKSYPGLNRAQVEFTVPADAQSYKVFYNNGQYLRQEVDGEVQKLIVEGLPEGEQILRVVTLNAAGEASDPKGVKVNVYGDNYLATLTPRKYVEENVISESSVEIRFGEASANEEGVWLVFTSAAGALDSLMMENSATSIRIDNINLDEPYYYYSIYKPEPESIDFFPSSRVDAKNAAMFIFNKEEWTIAGVSDEEPGEDNAAANVIDNDADTDWHSEVTPDVKPMPHWIAVDMGNEKKMDGFYFVQTQKPEEQGLARHFDFSVSNDGEEWTKVLSGEFRDWRIRQQFPFATRQSARYFKLTITSGYNDADWSQCGEIDLYNELNVSGINGSVPFEVLTNNKKPLAVENPHAWDSGRMQQLVGWTHNDAAVVSYDGAIDGGSIAMFSIPGGIDYITNGKVYQTIELDAGDYTMVYDCGSYNHGAGVLAYGVIATGQTLPDITDIETSSATLTQIELTAKEHSPDKVNLVPFSLASPTTVSIGWVYNTFTNGEAWNAFYLNEVELLKKQ